MKNKIGYKVVYISNVFFNILAENLEQVSMLSPNFNERTMQNVSAIFDAKAGIEFRRFSERIKESNL